MSSKLKAKQPEEVSPGKPKALLFGTYGSGKSWMALSFPKPYYYDTEGGADLSHYQAKLKAAGGAYLGPKDGTLNPDFLIEQMMALATEAHPYKTLVIDSITKLYQTIIANEAERLGEKDAFGASKKPAIAFMRRLVNWTNKLDMTIWFIAHETTEWGKNEKTGQREEVGKIPDCWDKIPYELHLAMWVQKRGASNRVAIVRKSRLLEFPEGDVIPLQSNGEDVGYAEFAKRYGRDYIEAESKTITLATTEQVAEILRLLGCVKVTDSEVEKVFTKAGVESWNELTTEQAVQTISWLQKKVSK
jgi:hypothetical protein